MQVRRQAHIESAIFVRTMGTGTLRAMVDVTDTRSVGVGLSIFKSL